MTDKIERKLEDKLQELFFEIQEEEGITNGEVEFGLAFELDELQEKLVECIEKVLNYQKKMDEESEVQDDEQ